VGSEPPSRLGGWPRWQIEYRHYDLESKWVAWVGRVAHFYGVNKLSSGGPTAVSGRWLSPDPVGLGAVDPSNPQTWNRYSYVYNNPLSLIDPLGEDCYTDGTCWRNADWSLARCGGFCDGFSVIFSGSYLAPAPGAICSDGGCTAWETVYPNFGVGIVPGGTNVTPGAVNARDGVIAILSGKNPCSDYFNQREGMLKPAAELFAAVPIIIPQRPIPPLVMPNGQIGVVNAQTLQGNPGAPIELNINGAFFQTGSVYGSSQVPGGTYPSGSTPAQMAILMHELAHKLNLIPNDANSIDQSKENTKKVLEKCAGAINGD